MELDAVRMICAVSAVAAGTFTSGYGEAYIATRAIDGMARNPESSDKLFTSMIVGMALDESTAIYCFVVALIILFVI